MAAFRAKLQILSRLQLSLWHHLKPITDMGFVLYGGTAVALRLGHRYSVDFDFFTDRALDVAKIYAHVSFLKDALLLQSSKDMLTVVVKDHLQSVKFSFFGGIDFGRVADPDYTDDGVLLVASKLDLMATKLKVIFQRAEAKDYRDIAGLLNSGVRLADGLASAKAIFGNQFQVSDCLKALVFFEDGDLATLANEQKAILINSVKNFKSLPAISIKSKHLND